MINIVSCTANRGRNELQTLLKIPHRLFEFLERAQDRRQRAFERLQIPGIF